MRLGWQERWVIRLLVVGGDSVPLRAAAEPGLEPSCPSALPAGPLSLSETQPAELSPAPCQVEGSGQQCAEPRGERSWGGAGGCPGSRPGRQIPVPNPHSLDCPTRRFYQAAGSPPLPEEVQKEPSLPGWPRSVRDRSARPARARGSTHECARELTRAQGAAGDTPRLLLNQVPKQ